MCLFICPKFESLWCLTVFRRYRFWMPNILSRLLISGALIYLLRIMIYTFIMVYIKPRAQRFSTVHSIIQMQNLILSISNCWIKAKSIHDFILIWPDATQEPQTQIKLTALIWSRRMPASSWRISPSSSPLLTIWSGSLIQEVSEYLLWSFPTSGNAVFWSEQRSFCESFVFSWQEPSLLWSSDSEGGLEIWDLRVGSDLWCFASIQVVRSTLLR